MKRVINKFSVSLVLLILIVAAVATVILLNRPSHSKSDTTASKNQSSNSSTSGKQASLHAGRNQSASSSPNQGSSKLPTPPSGGALKAPTGTFVSNHRPSLSQSSSDSLESSICNTTPGAQCVITFTKDGVTKSLDSETANSYGNASWTWRPASIGLSAGSWQITAQATLDSQTQTATDPVALEVSQ